MDKGNQYMMKSSHDRTKKAHTSNEELMIKLIVEAIFKDDKTFRAFGRMFELQALVDPHDEKSEFIHSYKVIFDKPDLDIQKAFYNAFENYITKVRSKKYNVESNDGIIFKDFNKT